MFMGLIYRSVETMSHHISKSTQLVILSIWHCFGFLEDNFWKILLSKIVCKFYREDEVPKTLRIFLPVYE